MSAVREIVDRLVAGGMSPGDATELVMRAINNESRDSHVMRHVTMALEARRAADRKRQKSLRLLRKQASTRKQTMSGQAGDMSRDNAAAELFAQENTMLPSLSNSVVATKKGKKDREDTRARGTRIERRQANSEETDYALKLGLPMPETWDEYLDYWIAIPGGRGRKTDWPATWRNRCRYLVRQNRGKNGKRTVQDAAADLLERVRAFSEPAPGSIRDGTGQADVRLLSPRRGE